MTLPILIGQYDSPFVRRVAITMTIYGRPFERRNWSVFRDAESIAAYNPLRRVPVLVLPDGEALVESAAIVDALDDEATDAQVLLPRRGPQRRAGLRIASLAGGLCDKAVSLVYERVAREEGTGSERWNARCSAQVEDTLRLLEQERAAATTRWWLGDALGHPDIAVAVAVRFVRQAVPQLFEKVAPAALIQHEAICQAMPAFAAIDLPLYFPHLEKQDA